MIVLRIWAQLVPELLLWAIAGWGVFRLLHRLCAHPLLPLRPLRLLRRFLPPLEFLFWSAFLLRAIENSLAGHPAADYLQPVLLILFLLLATWIAGRDLVAGLVLNLQHRFGKGQWIRLEEVEGHILRTGLLSLELQQKDNRIVKIPYSRIAGRLYYRDKDASGSPVHQLSLPIPAGMSADAARNALYQSILLAPWSPLNCQPHIELHTDAAGCQQAEITLQLSDPAHIRPLEKYLRDWFARPAD